MLMLNIMIFCGISVQVFYFSVNIILVMNKSERLQYKPYLGVKVMLIETRS